MAMEDYFDPYSYDESEDYDEDSTQYYLIKGTIKHETDKAMLFYINKTRKDEWIPLSLISYIKRQPTNTSLSDDIISIPLWLATKKGLT